MDTRISTDTDTSLAALTADDYATIIAGKGCALCAYLEFSSASRGLMYCDMQHLTPIPSLSYACKDFTGIGEPSEHHLFIRQARHFADSGILLYAKVIEEMLCR